ncbi:uncharacterized protein [Pyrus communis]|uniref:uncharacterized protein n=1 Tax=Pyrus communis TaxID=23211 RepID=UPI0035C0F131
MANLSRSPFTDEIKQMEPSRKFSPSYFTLFKGDEDSDIHLMHYQNAITLYANNDTLMCKIFAMTLQVFIEEYSSYCSIKKKSDHLFNMKNGPNESLHTYVKRFKAEKAKIIRYDDNVACSAFRKGLLTDHPLFEELIMCENITLTDFYALAEKHSLSDEAKLSQKPHK